MTTPTTPRPGSAVPGATIDRQGRHWTQKETDTLILGIERYWDITTLAKRLGRTTKAVTNRRIRIAEDSWQERSWTLNGLVGLFGDKETRVKAWVRAGFFRVRKPGAHRVRHVIDTDDLLAFLADKTHWHEWEPSMLTDDWLREWATEQRGTERWLSVQEAASVLALTEAALSWRIKHGRIPARRRIDGSIRLRSDWVSEHTFAVRRFTKQPWTDEDIAFLREWRPYNAIGYVAPALARSTGSVANKCQQLGLVGPTIPQRERQYHGRPREQGVPS